MKYVEFNYHWMYAMYFFVVAWAEISVFFEISENISIFKIYLSENGKNS